MIWLNKSNISVPEYLNEEFLTRALEEGLREANIAIDKIAVTWGSNPGENYCSSIYRMVVRYRTVDCNNVKGEEQEISLIVKTIPITKGTQFLQDVGVFIKEKCTYTDVLPRLNILIDGDKFGANCIYAVKCPVQTIVFNDLTVEGFGMASRHDGLDMNHATLILQQLGKFHATSMVLAKRVDFQLSFYGSPGCDLNFFLNTSIPLDMLKTRRDDLISCYYKVFSQTLTFLRYSPVPTMDDLKYELRSRALYGLFALFGFLPMVTMPKEYSTDASIDAFTNDEEKDKKISLMFARESLHEHLRYGLKRFDALGVLDEF